MPEYVAVKCKSCKARITVNGQIVNRDPNGVEVLLAPEGSVLCGQCGKNNLYNSGDCFVIEADWDEGPNISN